MSDPAKTTVHHALFAGRRRRFCLRLGEIEELEQLCGAGVGSIWKRLALADFKAGDIRETIRLGLIGGDMAPKMADAFVERYVDARPLGENFELAIAILRALIDGAVEAEEDLPGKDTAERSDDPATSPPSSSPEPLSDSPRSTSDA